MSQTILWQRIEGAILFGLGLLICWQSGSALPWWGAVLVFFAPDLSFAGYALGPKIGARCYNAVHIYGFGGAILALGLFLAMPLPVALGALWLAHSGFDRMLGYGLKSTEGFSVTHLGRIGRDR